MQKTFKRRENSFMSFKSINNLILESPKLTNSSKLPIPLFSLTIKHIKMEKTLDGKHSKLTKQTLELLFRKLKLAPFFSSNLNN